MVAPPGFQIPALDVVCLLDKAANTSLAKESHIGTALPPTHQLKNQETTPPMVRVQRSKLCIRPEAQLQRTRNALTMLSSLDHWSPRPKQPLWRICAQPRPAAIHQSVLSERLEIIWRLA